MPVYQLIRGCGRDLSRPEAWAILKGKEYLRPSCPLQSLSISYHLSQPFNSSLVISKMDVYLLQSPFASSPEFRFWRPPQLLCFQGNSPSGVNIVTAGGLIRNGDAVYMVVVDDLSLLGWSSCAAAGSSAKVKDHRHCLPVTKFLSYHYDLQQDPVGVIGTLVHFSLEYGYGLVRVNPEWFHGDEEAVRQAAIPIDRFDSTVDEPEMMDFVEFVTGSGEEVTGVVVAPQSYCLEAGGTQRKINGLVINTSSYSVKPEDCGIWVRRSIASDRSMLLGHIIGCSENSSYSMVVLPFEHFKDDLRRVVRRRAFNLIS
ncbi:hypothetical protein BJ170DRAFT_692525 [Xylariales sp. AK1849]|nr:hypothetical protein BJ170DRAFT_692525 [Xylariales sp. AK1849]